MFSIMIQKLLNKKWMVFCTLIGIILLIAIAVSNPLYKASSFQRMLMEEFDRYWETQGVWPAGFSTNITTIKGVLPTQIKETKEAVDKTIEEVKFPVKEYVLWYENQNIRAQAKTIRDGKKDKLINVAALSDFKEHITMIYGKFPEKGISKDGYIEVVASEAAMVNLDLLLDDEYEYRDLTNQEGDSVKIRVVGVFKAKDDSDIYWTTPDSQLKTQVFVEMDTFETTFIRNSIAAQWFVFWDYKQIKATDIATNVKEYQRAITANGLEDKTDDKVFSTIFDNYTARVKRIEATLSILQITVILLLCAFLYVISNQMLQMEQNEISLLKSRGASKGQIILLYFLQSTFLAFLSFLIGAPLGRVICGFLGSSTAFLEFKGTQTMDILYTNDVLVYSGVAIMIAIAMITIPVIKYSGITIVNLKQKKTKKRKSLWKRWYLDILCLAIAFYGYYSFMKNDQVMVEDVLLGQEMDPLLYISFSLFILGCGLFACRLQPYLLKSIYLLVKKRIKPAAYVSMIETIRTGYKQEFIILFMLLTVAIGISNTVLARTIIANTTANTNHVMGSEIILQEVWKNNMKEYQMGLADELIYFEPESTKYNGIPGIEENTKVLKRNLYLKTKGEDVPVELMGIETKGFSNITKMQDGLLPYDYHEYLNVLASDSEGVLVSENFMSVMGYKIGDVLTVESKTNKVFKGTIRGFVNYWPGYLPFQYELGDDKTLRTVDHYLVIGNLSSIQAEMAMYPYQVWMKSSDEGKGLYDWLNKEQKINIQKLENAHEVLDDRLGDTLIQGTMGSLSMNFIVVLILCSVGYLIYWIMSIRSRELLFGVLRAMGMQKKEIIWLLVIEQMCSGLFAMIAGGIIGALSSKLFVPMIQKAYAASDQVLPLEMVIQASDHVQLFLLIGCVVFIALLILARIISKMNISNALKLGED